MTEKFIVRRETHELNILARPQVEEKRFCPDCSRQVSWLVPEEAMVLAKKSLREVFRLVESGEFHFVESAEGFLFVCAESLSAVLKKE